MAYYFTFNFLYSIPAFSAIAKIYVLILPTILMFIPLFYLYLLSITEPGFKFKKNHSIHFSPAIVFALLNIPYLFAYDSDKIYFISHGYNMMKHDSFFSYLMIIFMTGIYAVFSLQFIFYTILAIKLYRNHKKYIEDSYSYTENINIDWVPVLIICFMVFFVFNDILYLVGLKESVFMQVLYNVAMLVITLFIGYKGMLQADLVINDTHFHTSALNPEANKTLASAADRQFTPELVQDRIIENQPDNELIQAKDVKKYSGSALGDDQKIVLISKLQQLMLSEKLYINAKLSIEDVATNLGTNSKYISQIVNETFNKNFYNFINSYRIEEAKRLLVSEESEKYSILGIAQSVGFVSKSAFNVAFKRLTGATPTEFKNKSLGIIQNPEA